MSLVWTESFIAFPRLEATPTLAESNATRSALGAASYRTFSGGDAYRIGVASDPNNPARAGIRGVRTVVSNSNLVGAAFGRKIPANTDDTYIGFSLYIPPTFTPGGTYNEPIFRVSLYPETAPTADFVTSDHFSGVHTAFGINPNLGIVKFNTTQSAIVPVIGSLNYFEIRSRGRDVSVWLNDALVLQTTVREQPAVVAWQWLNGTAGVPFADNWQVGNVYILTADDQAPNARLGPTTRVIGRRPVSDVEAEFSRPVGAPSNASVMAQDISTTPASSLQATAVGTQDVYDVGTDGDTAGATLVHAVVNKTIAANLEAEPHTLRSFIRSAGNDASEAGAVTMFEVLPSPTTLQFNAMARHPTKGIVAVGNGSGIYHSADNGITWTVISAGSGTIHNLDISFSENGNGMISTSNGQLLYCHDESPITSWTAMASGVTVPLVAIQGHDGVFIAVSTTSAATNTRLITYPLNTTPTVTSAGAPTTANRDVGWGGGYWMIKTNATTAIHRSLNGTTWETVTPSNLPGGTTGKKLQYTGGTTWVVMGDDATGAVTTTSAWVSTDSGSTWTIGNAITGTNIGIYDLGMVDGILFAAGYASVVTATGGLATADEGPALFYSRDNGINWTLMPFLAYERSGVNKAAWAVQTVIDNGLGAPLTAGFGGHIFASQARQPDAALGVLGGYNVVFGVASIDPATSAPWVPAAAADTDIGMVVNS